MAEKTFNLTWNNHLANLSGLFEGLYKSGLLTDTTLACQDGTLKAHRLVLAACSPYFERVFKEYCGQQPIFILKGVTVGEMECLLHFMYRGSIDITEERLPSLIKIATELEIRGLSADHQNEISNPYSNLERNNSQLNQQLNCPDGSIGTDIHLKSEDINSVSHIKIEDIEVEDDPMIMDSHEDNFEHPLPLDNNHIRNFPSSSHKRETRFNGKKRVSVGRVTRSSDFMNMKYKSLCEESMVSRNEKLDSRTGNNCSDPTVPEIQMDHETSQQNDSDDLLSNANENVKAVKRKFEALKEEKICRNTGNSLRVDKKQYKPYSCDLCTLAFTRASHLSRHRRVHTGERPFACTLCPRMFARQDKLKQHLDSHLQWPKKRTFSNESSTTKLVPIKNKRGRPRKVNVEQSEFEEILKFGEFSSMLNKTQSTNIKNDDKSELNGKSNSSEYLEATALKKRENNTCQENSEVDTM